ncbi:Serine/threonine-protein kinase StkP [Actinomadura rubteroloni]|uniref:Serine/threonine-protein kinase StkP n=1 Tax=Actinomadura rubteroloni TaxID=1926885 RepID=A0A2P4UNJ2_9ACTN|nr:BREX system serine/threonine kinase PglW [Actinomadura rubteroloni]POM26620.1 Serine/threonine-protein kinase StkP [Actinomadura rubteroloni]
MREGRWTTVTESEFDHERRGLEAIRALLPDADPWYAWSNFSFTSRQGRVREVDLLVITPTGLVMVELKNWHGRLGFDGGTWVQFRPSGSRQNHGNPFHLVDQKSKELAGLIRSKGEKAWVSPAVCFTEKSLRIELPENDRNGVHLGAEALVEALNERRRDARRQINGPDAKKIKEALGRVGIKKSLASFNVGPYRMHGKPLDTGPGWVDYSARHGDLEDPARIRIYLRSDEPVESVEAVARREAAVLRRFRHPGVVQFRDLYVSGHRAGPALAFDYTPGTLRLDAYLARYGDRLDLLDRLTLVRQLAETVRSAHSQRVWHRALAAGSVHVVPRVGDGTDPTGDAAWLRPRLQISEWQIALARGGRISRLVPSSLSSFPVADDAEPYLAPELTALRPDPVMIDVYGLGALAYLLVTGQAPGASQSDVIGRLEASGGLRPSAVLDDLGTDLDDFIHQATHKNPDERPSTVDEFLGLLDVVEEALTRPSDDPVRNDEPDKDPLDAVTGDVLAGRWEVRRKLGRGATGLALLVRDLAHDPARRGSRPYVVLKAAVTEQAADTLRREAEVMGRLDSATGIIRLIEPEPLVVGGRTVLVIEYVGDERGLDDDSGTGSKPSRFRYETVGRQIQAHGRLPVDQLESYGDYLFAAVDSLESEGIWHRDLKPDNIAIRVRRNRSKELLLIDFSHAGLPANHIESGTEGFLDPFLGSITRSSYDGHAERYSLAVTLHYMASREMPEWGGGRVTAPQTDPVEWPFPTIATEAFDPAIRDGLTAFFQKALHRDLGERFSDLKPMRDMWRRVFLDARTTTPSTPAGTDEEGTETVEQLRDRLAEVATRDTNLASSGLSEVAQSILFGLGLTTVGDLLDYSQRTLVNARGMGPKTRTEIQRRQREWGDRLGRSVPSPISSEGRADARRERAETGSADKRVAGTDTADAALRSLSLDPLVALFVPELRTNGVNRKEREMVRLLLRIPDEHGEPADIPAWPNQREVAEQIGLSTGRVPQMLKAQRARWKKASEVRDLRAQIIELLEEHDRIASVAEIADVLVRVRGTWQVGTNRRAMALAAVRAVIEVEQVNPDAAEFRHVANRRATDPAVAAGLLALEVRDGDDPDTPSAPGLLDYAQRLGKVADRLAKQESIPTATTVLAELNAITRPAGTIAWEDARLVQIAAAASSNAAASPRLEIYPRDLPLVRALRLTQAGLVPVVPGRLIDQQPGLTVEQIHERVLARFPEIAGGRSLPTGTSLTKELHEAGFNLKLGTHAETGQTRYVPADFGERSTSWASGVRRGPTSATRITRYHSDPALAAAARAEDQLVAAASRDGFRVLTVRMMLFSEALEELTGSPGDASAQNNTPGGRFGGTEVSATRLFLDALHSLTAPGKRPTWETILRADNAEPNEKSAHKFAEYATTALGRVEPHLCNLLASGNGPIILTDATVFAHYNAMDTLSRIADAARSGKRGLWLVCPQSDPAREPRLGRRAVPYQPALSEWVELNDHWARNRHRSEEVAPEEERSA